MNNPLLTICIPTYNRDVMLNKCLTNLYELQSLGHRFNLVVGDNGSNDTTQDVLNHWKQKFENIILVLHPENIGYDRNVASLYKEVKTDYFWLLGDCDAISPQHYSLIEKRLESGYDALIINTEAVVLHEDKHYSDACTFASEQCWHISKLSSIIMRREALLSEQNIDRYFDCHFIHVGTLMEYLCAKESINVYFDSKIHLIYMPDDTNLRNKQKGGWRQIPFHVWGRCWCQMVLALPFKIPYEMKMKIIKDHERQYHWFSIKNLIKSKVGYGMPFVQNYKENHQFVKLVTVASPWLSDMVMYLPIDPIFKALINLHQRMLKMKK